MTHLILNPAAGGYRAGKLWPKIQEKLQSRLGELRVHRTKTPKDALRICTEIFASIPQSQKVPIKVIAVGGDGTHHEVVNGIYQALGPNQLHLVEYALLPLGSGNDWIRTHRIPKDVEKWIDVFLQGNTRLHNLGSITYTSLNGQVTQSIFTNVAGMAYDAFVLKRSMTAKFKSRLLYPILTLAYLRNFTPPELLLSYDGHQIKQQFHTINVGVCRYSGGGMSLVPQANPFSNQLALTYAPKLSILEILINGWRFYTSTIGKIKGVVCTNTKAIEVKAINSPKDLLLEADGELLGYGPIRFQLLEQKLAVIVPA